MIVWSIIYVITSYLALGFGFSAVCSKWLCYCFACVYAFSFL